MPIQNIFIHTCMDVHIHVSSSLTIREFNLVPPLHRSTGNTFAIKFRSLCNRLTADSFMAESVHRGPLKMGTTLESTMIQNSSKESWLNCSASVTISSSSSSLAWEALLSDRLEFDWSSLKYKQVKCSQLPATVQWEKLH